MAGLRPEITDLAGRYRRLLEASFGARLIEVRVFGSQARGDASPDSDLDVSVTITGLTEAERTRAIDLAFEAWCEGDRRGPLLSALVWSEIERREWLESERRIAIDIEREGIPV